VKYLFVHQNFPGQFLHIVRHLVKSRRHEIVFITEPNANHIAGVRKLPYRKPDPGPPDTHWVAREFEAATRRAETVARTAANLKQLGFEPDVIIGHHGWGELLDLPDIWPDAPLVGYLEFFYRTDGQDVGFDPEFPNNPLDFPRIRAKNATNLLALNLGAHGQTPTEWQLSTYPTWARPLIEKLPEGVDLTTCKPDPAVRREAMTIAGMEIAPTDRLVTYVARDLEPYRGFHMMMRALPHILEGRADTKAVLIGGDGVSYGAGPAGTTWRALMMRELGPRLDLGRVAFPGRVDYDTYRRLLQRSDAHVYLTYPFVASWSLREALAMGCVVIGSDTEPVREFIADGRNGLLAPFFAPKRLAERVLEVLEDAALSRRLRAGARRYAERHLDLNDTLAAYDAMVDRLTAPRRPVGRVRRAR
jgi:glycosyltransferase involved in cell wall biosynthesis